MQSRLTTYLNFDGNAREAMEFYQSVLGGELVLNTFGESGMATEEPESSKVMHSMLTAESGMTLMASDRPSQMPYSPMGGFSIALSGDNDEELTRYYEGLSQGGTIAEPLTLAPWGDKFGYFDDKFGVSWMVNISGKK